MRNVALICLILVLTSPAWGETTVREYPDRIVIEVTGPPPTAGEAAARERQERRRELESTLQRLAAEKEELATATQDVSGDVRQRRERLVSNRRETARLQGELQDIDRQEVLSETAQTQAAAVPPTHAAE